MVDQKERLNYLARCLRVDDSVLLSASAPTLGGIVASSTAELAGFHQVYPFISHIDEWWPRNVVRVFFSSTFTDTEYERDSFIALSV